LGGVDGCTNKLGGSSDEKELGKEAALCEGGNDNFEDLALQGEECKGLVKVQRL
jgi:hypothetical protein